ncbi:hypothetical protein ACWEJZ_02080 [Streptomyces bacillaris]|uniref:hypothetical protein n=1 Tax=Streptomyces sp. S8 TaxID=1837283 RepID=UPI000A09230E|nr:hypothetical protein [Streptomyces sp. S8]ARI52206.1 hypothetical protein A6E92_08450 [Streptomyces sp. S8]
MSYSETSSDFTAELVRQASALVGQAVTLRLANGDDIAGTLTGFDGLPVVWPAGEAPPKRALVVEDADDKTWHIRPDAVLGIAG